MLLKSGSNNTPAISERERKEGALKPSEAYSQVQLHVIFYLRGKKVIPCKINVVCLGGTGIWKNQSKEVKPHMLCPGKRVNECWSLSPTPNESKW